MNHEMLQGGLLAVAAYLVGAIPFGLWVAHAARGVDVRVEGSGNIGATNVARTAGRGWGFVTLVLDALKGAAPVLLAIFGLRLSLTWVLLAGLMAILGHVFPVYLGFRGGKGVATAAGVFLALTPVATGIAIAAFVLTFAVTRVVGLGSMVGAGALAALTAFVDGRPSVVVLAAGIGVLVLVRHIGNIRRLLEARKRSNTGRTDS